MKKRYTGLDCLKAICALLVVFIHIPFEFKYSSYITMLSRIAVPIFFMITGFFYKDIVENKKEKKQIKKIFNLFLVSNIFYFILYLIDATIKGNVVSYFKRIISIKQIIAFLVFNESPFSSHLWYLNAILYVLIIMYIIKNKKIKNYLIYLIPFLLISDLILGKYSPLFFDFKIPFIFLRNFLFVGIPFFTIGDYIKQNEDKIVTKINKKGNIKLLVILIAFIILSICEKALVNYLNINSTRDHYITTTLLSICLFIVFLNIKDKNRVTNKLEIIGRKYSTFIYIIHPFFVYLLANNMKGNAYYNVLPFIIYIISIYTAKMYYLIKDKIKQKNK